MFYKKILFAFQNVFLPLFYRKAPFNFPPKMRHSLFVDIQHLNKHKFIKNYPCEECRYLTYKMWSLRSTWSSWTRCHSRHIWPTWTAGISPVSCSKGSRSEKSSLSSYLARPQNKDLRIWTFKHSELFRENAEYESFEDNTSDILHWCSFFPFSMLRIRFFCWEKSVSCMGEVIY